VIGDGSDVYGEGVNIAARLEALAEPGGICISNVVRETPGNRVEADFTGGAVNAFAAGAEAWGILAVDLETEPGVYELTLKMGAGSVKTSIVVTRGGYGTERLRLPKSMVEFDKKTLERIGREAAELAPVWGGSYPEPLFNGPFAMPLEGRVSGEFGTRRVLNGSPRSPHSGIDLAAPAGTPVKAANSGRVAFVGDFFFKGRFVVLDHGLGIFSSYSHLSAVDVEPGELVERGARIGAVGSTGRATGPHLHFAMRVDAKRISPIHLFDVAGRLLDYLPRAVSNKRTPASG